MNNQSRTTDFSHAGISRHAGQRRFQAAHNRRAAFTLIELAVVFAVLAILCCVLAPALCRTAPNSGAFQCLNNLRQLSAAWIMYSDDNRGKLVPNRDGGNAGQSSADAAWVAGWLDFTSSPANTNTAMLINHDRYPYGAYLGPYLKTPKPFKCPADLSAVTIAGQKLPRARSVSMNGRVGDMTRSWLQTTRFLMYKTTADLYDPSPSRLFVFVDEREDSINDGVFQSDPDTLYQLVDYPASYHNGAGAFGFADGHGEIHAWRDRRTMPALVPGQLLPLNVNISGDRDVLWLQQHCTNWRWN
ncbi:MAG TPA: type II secretion system protein [Verrucomicrobiae bacterium]